MKKIPADKRYSLKEIVDLGLIPHLTSYGAIYNLVTARYGTSERTLVEETTKNKIRAEHDGLAWNKISGKIFVRGSEINTFIKLNNLK